MLYQWTTANTTSLSSRRRYARQIQTLQAEWQTVLAPDAAGLNFGFGEFHVQNFPGGVAIPDVHNINTEAIEKATKLLLACLSGEQVEMFRESGYFEVVTRTGNRYRITKGWAGNVLLISNGKATARYCIHHPTYVPLEDLMLAQKLLLETDEQQFLRTANRTLLRAA